MKKIFVLFLAIFAMAMFSMPAFAFKMGTSDNTTVDLSANVGAAYNGGTNGISYAAATYNPKGTGKAYGTASDTTYIYYKTETSDNETAGAEDALGSAANASAATFTDTTKWTQLGD